MCCKMYISAYSADSHDQHAFNIQEKVWFQPLQSMQIGHNSSTYLL